MYANNAVFIFMCSCGQIIYMHWDDAHCTYIYRGMCSNLQFELLKIRSAQNCKLLCKVCIAELATR